ncbi:MAG: alpha/beta hydrolase [Dehalococcoidales bacterium]|nr:MAG: alpha/beta hydrolase [Dehalococcoidales bacterium]
MKDSQIYRDIVYAQSGMKLDIYTPAEITTPLPVIVFIHGGAWRMGDKESVSFGLPYNQMVEQGYVFVSINYRLSHEAAFPAQIHDCKAAIRWIRAHAEEYDIDPERIGAWGPSAGGHLAALLGTSAGISELEGDGGNPQYSSSVQAVCDFYGPTDLIRMSEMKGELEKESPESLMIGGPLLENVDKVTRANPITHITPDSPPFLIVHGEKDVVVPPDQSRILYDALLKANIEAELQIIPEAIHGFNGISTEQLDEIKQMVSGFFNRHLK